MFKVLLLWNLELFPPKLDTLVALIAFSSTQKHFLLQMHHGTFKNQYFFQMRFSKNKTFCSAAVLTRCLCRQDGGPSSSPLHPECIFRRTLTPAIHSGVKQTQGNVKYVVHSLERPVSLQWKQLWPSDVGIYCEQERFEGVRV